MFLARGIKHRKVMIESLGSEVFIRPMSYAAMVDVSECKTVALRGLVTVVHGLVDESGTPLFTMEERDLLASSMDYYTIQEIASKIIQISAFTDSELVK